MGFIALKICIGIEQRCYFSANGREPIDVRNLMFGLRSITKTVSFNDNLRSSKLKVTLCQCISMNVVIVIEWN